MWAPGLGAKLAICAVMAVASEDMTAGTRGRVLHYEDGYLVVYGRMDMTPVESVAENLIKVTRKMMKTKNPPETSPNTAGHWPSTLRRKRCDTRAPWRS